MASNIKTFLARPLFKIDGLTFTIGIVLVAIVLIWLIYRKKR